MNWVCSALEEVCSAAIIILFFAAGWVPANMGTWLHLERLSCRVRVYCNTLLLNKTKASPQGRNPNSTEESNPGRGL